MKISAIQINPSFHNSITNRKIKRDNASSISSGTAYNYLESIAIYNMAFKGTPVPIYAIDEEGNYQKFPERRVASEELNISASNISNCLYGTTAKIKGYTFMKASDIETTDANGDTVVDESKIKARLQEIKEKDPYKNHRKAIYRIDKEGNYQRFDSLTDVAQEMQISIYTISDCLNGKQKTTKQYGFMFAKDLEEIDAEGNVKINEEKLRRKAMEVEKIVSEQFEQRPFYAVDKDGNYQRFERYKDATETLFLYHPEIKKCLDGERFTSNGYAFIYADEVESVDEDGNIIVNINFPKEKFDTNAPVYIYSVDEKARVKIFQSIYDAAEYYSASRQHIKDCLNGERNMTRGCAFIRANEFEITTEDGRTKINPEKLEELFNGIIKNAVYVVYKDGYYERYASASEAANYMNVRTSDITHCANGSKKDVNGCLVVKASLIETLKNGKVEINKTLLAEYAKQAEALEGKAVIAIDKQGHRKKFKNSKKAAETLGLDIRDVNKCIKGKSKTTKGFRFEYAKTKEEIAQMIEKKQQDKIIYAIRGSEEILEFKDINEAAEKLNVDKTDIQKSLRRGITKYSGTINGYVFSTGGDA